MKCNTSSDFYIWPSDINRSLSASTDVFLIQNPRVITSGYAFASRDFIKIFESAFKNSITPSSKDVSG